MSFERVLNGIVRYLNCEVFKEMNDWQEMFARIAVSRIIGNPEALKHAVMDNAFIKTFGIIDADGNIDINGLMQDIRTHISQKGKLTVSLPMFGSFTFTAEDVDKLHRMIMEG